MRGIDDATNLETASAKLDEILARLGGGAAALAQAEHLSLDELQALAAGFGETGLTGKAGLLEFLTRKAEDFRRLEGEIAALKGVSDRIDNIRAAAEAAVADLRLDEASRLLEDAHETIRDQLREPLEANAKLMEAQADIALIRGWVEEAYRILSAAADSFASLDPIEPARRRLEYEDRLYRHGLRYGGRGLALAAEMARAGLDSVPAEREPDLWVALQNNLGNALRVQGERKGGAAGAALLEEAVAAYRAALRVRTEPEHPVDWAMTQNNLAVALEAQGERKGGAEGAALLEEAVAAYGAALRVWTEAEHPVDWAMTQNNLGNALSAQGERKGGAEGAALLAEAVAAYGAALRVWTEAEHPVNWAGTQNNLGNALRAQGERTGGAEGAALMAEAVAACRAALRVRTEADHPVDWAMTMENIARAEAARADHESCAAPWGHLEAALAHVEAALRVFDPEHMPFNHAKATGLRDRLAARLAALS